MERQPVLGAERRRRGLVARSAHAGHPSDAVAPADNDPRNDEDAREARGVVEGEGPERDETRSADPHLVVDRRRGGDLPPRGGGVGESGRPVELEAQRLADADDPVAAPLEQQRAPRVGVGDERRNRLGPPGFDGEVRHAIQPRPREPVAADARPVGWDLVSRADLRKDPDDVSGMFNGVAARYDRTNTVMSVGNDILWRIATTRAIDPKPGERILDIACGTGTSTVPLARSGATVVGVDFSPEMIAEAERKHPRLEFRHADAMKLPFGDDEFDAVTISFGLRNVQEPKVALAEMYRVLKPGGRLVVCEFSKPPRALLRAGYNAYLNLLAPVVAGLTSSNPEAYRYLVESIRDWPDQQTLSQWIRGVGTRVAYRNLTAGVVALHRGRKPEDQAIRAATARRTRRPRSAAVGPAD